MITIRGKFMKGIKLISIILALVLLYLFTFGVVIFNFIPPKQSDYLDTTSVERFFSEKEGADRVLLFEEGFQSGVRRLSLVKNAQQSIDISSYTFLTGEYTDIFMGSILMAADRGVKVRILLDGVLYGHLQDSKQVAYAFYRHPNIEFKLYEPLNLFKPWTLNNRLHDKFMVVDNKWAVIGGRNIGDKYVDLSEEEKVSHDREVMIINTEEDNLSDSAIQEFVDYYNLLWESEFASYPVRRFSGRKERKGQEKAEELIDYTIHQKAVFPQLFDSSLNWIEEESFPTKKVSLIHNPLKRMNKEPWVWIEINRLKDISSETIFVQSPYIIPTKMVRSFMSTDEFDGEITVLTNSIASNPNNLGLSGHMPYRKRKVDFVEKVYEYQGAGSLHAKTYIFDKRISLIGSYNLDPRSTFLSTETMAVIDSVEFAEHLMEAIGNLYDKSLIVDKDYTYLENDTVEEKKAPFLKRTIVRFCSVLTFPFRHML